MTRRFPHPTAAVIIAAAILALITPAAGAKVWFNDFHARTIHWDQRVSSTILGCPGNASCRNDVKGVTVYLRRGQSSRPGIHRKGLHKLARINPNGTLRFRAPHLPAGRYHLVAFMRSAGAWLPVSETFSLIRR
jgi:hypothetical protein